MSSFKQKLKLLLNDMSKIKSTSKIENEFGIIMLNTYKRMKKNSNKKISFMLNQKNTSLYKSKTPTILRNFHSSTKMCNFLMNKKSNYPKKRDCLANTLSRLRKENTKNDYIERNKTRKSTSKVINFMQNNNFDYFKTVSKFYHSGKKNDSKNHLTLLGGRKNNIILDDHHTKSRNKFWNESYCFSKKNDKKYSLTRTFNYFKY